MYYNRPNDNKRIETTTAVKRQRALEIKPIVLGQGFFLFQIAIKLKIHGKGSTLR